MNKGNLKTNVSVLTLVFALGLCGLTEVNAESITYTGTQAEYDNLPARNGDVNKRVIEPSSAEGNFITVKGGAGFYAPYEVFGGISSIDSGIVQSNTVVINDEANVANAIHGGTAQAGKISNNTVKFNSVTHIDAKVFGGSSLGSGYVDSNTVTINDGEFKDDIQGGFSSLGDAQNNSVYISGVAKISGRIYGGIVDSGYGKALNNTVTIDDNVEVKNVNNVGDPFLRPKVVGGSSNAGLVQENKLKINSGTFGVELMGGYSEAGNVKDNEVYIGKSANLVNGSIYVAGGESYDGEVTGNNVTIERDENSSVINTDIFGGFGRRNKMVSFNRVTINGGKFTKDVAGGDSKDGDVNYNSVHLSGDAKLYGNIYGGRSSSGTGAALNNTVTIDGNVLVQHPREMKPGETSEDVPWLIVSGGYSDAGLVQGNKLIINSGSFNAENLKATTVSLRGGLSKTGIVKKNEVYIGKDANLSGSALYVAGGESSGGISDNDVSENRVIIERDKNSSVINASISGGLGGGNIGNLNARVADNQVIINGGIFGDDTEIIGGEAFQAISATNIVDISNAKVGIVWGGFSNSPFTRAMDDVIYNKVGIHDHSEVTGDLTGGFSTHGNAIGNELVIDSFSTTRDIAYGGGSNNGIANNNKLSLSGNAHAGDDISGGISWEGSVSGNSVSIEDAIIDKNVYGGQSHNGSATDNSVTLIGQNIKIGGTIFGGFDDSKTRSESDIFSGNTLNLNHFRGDVVGIQNFENYNWLLPKDVVNNDTLIHITGENPVNLANTKHKVMLENDGNRLNVGDKVTLIDKVENAPTIASMEVKQGNFIIYDMKVEQASNGNDGAGLFVLTAQNKTEIKEDDDQSKTDNNDTTTTNGDGNKDKTPTVAGRINPQTKSFSEARAAALGFLNQGADLIADAGIRAAKSSVADAGNNPSQMNFVPFLVINGSSSRYKTGSHVDVDGFNMVVGLATGFELANKHPVTLGAFFEYGRGTYNSYNSFANYASVHGDGDTHYTGGGILGRIEFAGTGLAMVEKLPADRVDGLYAEASFRAGKIDTDFDTDDILTGYNNSRYDSKANYYGLHGGIGYVFNFDERNSLDVYGRYFWTKIDSETVNIGRDRLHFDEANSSRIRIGGRYTYTYNEQLKPYIGVAYDHEFDGEIAARAYNLKLDKPSLEGDTGIFEAGISLTPVNTIKALSIDVTGQAFVGRREGGGGGLKVKYEF